MSFATNQEPFTIPQPPALLRFEDFRGRPILRTCADARQLADAIYEGHLENWNLLSADAEWLSLEVYQEAGLWRNVFESSDLAEIQRMVAGQEMPWRVTDSRGNVYRRGDGAAEVIV